MAPLIQSTTVLWLRWSCLSALPRGAAISSASRKPLNSRLWLIPTGTSVSVSSSSVPSLRRATVWTTPPFCGSSPATAIVSTSGRPSMRAAGHPNSSSAGRLQRVTEPSRSVRTKRASTSWRSSSSTASAWAVAGLDSCSDTSQYMSARRRADTSPERKAARLFVQAKAVLQNALHARVQGIKAVERERLGRAEAAAGQGIRAVMGEDAVRERVELRRGEAVQPRGALGHELLPQRQVTHQRAGLAQRYLGAQVELERLAGVVEDRGAEQKVGVEPGVERARLVGERADGHGVLDQPAQEGVVAEERVEQAPEVLVVHLPCQVLEEAVELLHVAVGHRQELGRIARLLARTPDRLQRHLKLVAKALDTPAHAHEVAALELPGEEVGVPERAAGDRARAVAQFDRQIGRSVLGRQAILARAREDPLDLAACSQLSDGHAVNRDRGIGRRVP